MASRRSPSPPLGPLPHPPPGPAASVVALCQSALEPGQVLELPASAAPTRVVSIDNVPAFVSLSEALTLLLTTPTSAATAANVSRKGRGPSPAVPAAHPSPPPRSGAAEDNTATTTNDDDDDDDVSLARSVVSAAVALSTSPSVYMVLLVFASADDAAAVHRRHHMKRLSTLAEERLVVRFIVDPSSSAGGGAAAAAAMADGSSAVASVFPFGGALSSSTSVTPGTASHASPANLFSPGMSPTRSQPPPPPPPPPPPNPSAAPATLSPLPPPRGAKSPLAAPGHQQPKSPASAKTRSASTSAGTSPMHGGAAQLASSSHGATAAPSSVCPICLDPLGLRPAIALPCGHVFDFSCFRRVDEGVCPLCRFNVAESRATCAACDAAGDLWMCLVCGDVNCGRYGRRHAAAHFEAAPTHRYFMQVGGLRVWDMASDSFVHRVIATSDGGMTAVGGGGGGETNNGGGGVPPSAFQWADLMSSDDDDHEDGYANSSFGRAAGGDVLDAVAQSRVEAVGEFYGHLTEELLAAQHAHFVAAIDADRDSARDAVFAAERRARIAIAGECAAGYGRMTDESLAALERTARAAKQRLSKARERRATALATVEAQRVNVAHLERMAAAKAAATPLPPAAPATSGPEGVEIAALEAKLERLYSQFA